MIPRRAAQETRLAFGCAPPGRAHPRKVSALSRRGSGRVYRYQGRRCELANGLGKRSRGRLFLPWVASDHGGTGAPKYLPQRAECFLSEMPRKQPLRPSASWAIGRPYPDRLGNAPSRFSIPRKSAQDPWDLAGRNRARKSCLDSPLQKQNAMLLVLPLWPS